MNSLLFLLKLCFLLVVAVYAQDNIIKIEFRRISDSRPDKPQIVTELLVDYLSKDTFEILCKLNNVSHLNTLEELILWQSDGPLNIRIQNVDPSVTETYHKPKLYSNVTKWTGVGRFDNVTSNSRNTTLGLSRPVSSFTCTDARMYTCYVNYINSDMKNGLLFLRKELEVQVIPSKITKQIFGASGDGETIISDLTNSTTIVHVSQKLRLQCTANIGSFNSSVSIVWMQSTPNNGSQLVPFTSGKQNLGEPKAFGSYLNDGNMEMRNKTKAEEFTVISAIIGGVCALVILGVAGIFLKRKFSNPGFSKADGRSEETSPRPDETNTSFPLARVSETPAEIDQIENIQRQRTEQPTASFKTTLPLQYGEFNIGTRENSKLFTELDCTICQNICT